MAEESRELNTLDLFVDREQPQELFDACYAKMQAAMKTDDTGTPAKPFVLNFYGDGGIGKSRLREKLMSRMEGDLGPAVCYDFDAKQDKSAEATLAALGKRLADAFKFDFPLFEYARFFYEYKCGNANASDDDPTKAKPILERHPLAKLALETFGPSVPIVGPILNSIVGLADIVTAEARSRLGPRLDARKKELAEIHNCKNVDELPKKFSYYFALDLADNMKDRKKPLVIFLDTYEALVNSCSGQADYESNDLWLRDTAKERGLIPHVPGVLWVILGRNELSWASASAWKDIVKTYCLDTFGEAYSIIFLKNAGITDEPLCFQLAELTGGLPLDLNLCMDIYNSLTAQGRIPTIEDFGTSRDGLVECLIRDMGDKHASILYRLSCLDSWTDALLRSFLTPDQRDTYRTSIRKLSLISCRDGVYTIHSVIRNILQAGCDPDLRDEALEDVEKYYRELLDTLSPEDENYALAFTSFAKYGADRREEAPEKLTVFFETELKDRAYALLELHKAFPVHRCVQDLLARPTAEARLLVEANILYSKVLRQNSWHWEEMAFAPAEMAVELSKTLSAHNEATEKINRSLALSAVVSLANLHRDYTSSPLQDRQTSLPHLQTAVELGEQALSGRIDLLGEKAPDTIAAMVDLAQSYSWRGFQQWSSRPQEGDLADLSSSTYDFQKALGLWQEVLAYRADTLGPYAPKTLEAMEMLSNAYYNLNNDRVALELRKTLLKRWIAARDNAQGDDREEKERYALDAMYRLARAYDELGEYQEAISWTEKVVAGSAAFRGEDHVLTKLLRAYLNKLRKDQQEQRQPSSSHGPTVKTI